MAPTRYLREFRLDNVAELEVGNELTVSQFEAGEKIDVSGVSKGFGQTALGHETYELVRTHFTQEAKPYLHGEIVAIGDCLQLAFNGHPEQVAPFRDFMRSMNMPLTLEDIGIDPNSPKMENLFQDLFHSPFMEPTAENEARLRKAMHYLSAD